MARTFMDSNLMNWEVYVSGGQPASPEAARLFFLCLDSRMSRARFVEHDSRDVSVAERELLSMTDDELRDLLAKSTESD
ncbi:MAG: hypothetical protein ABFS14_09460 [Gemmatimonadota bacterium]